MINLLKFKEKLELIRILIVGLASLLFYLNILPLSLLSVAVTFGLYSLVKSAAIGLYKERKIGTELFITFAVIIAFLGQEYLAGAIVLMIILIAELIALINTERARASIRALVDTMPKVAIVKRNGREEELPIDQIIIGDVVLVRAGEKITVDGIVIHGRATVNQAPITGESIPQEKTDMSSVYAGTIVESGAIDIKVEKLSKDTLFSRIISMVEEAQNKQAPIQKFADKVASYLIPIVFIFVLSVFFYTRDVKLIIALLIFTSPAEIGLATPLVIIAAIARAAREGILLKGGVFLEELAKVKVMIFDKTGTITTGKPSINMVEIIDQSYTKSQLIQLAASANKRSSHPLAKALIEEAKELNLSLTEPQDFNLVTGRGVKVQLENREVLVGNKLLLEEHNVPLFPLVTDLIGKTAIYIAASGKVLGVIFFTDTIRKEAKQTLKNLREEGIEQLYLLTGDNEATAQALSNELGFDAYQANLLPEDKIRFIQELQSQNYLVAMVGDGINDAPALAQANVGIAMGLIGTEAAMEAADVVLVDDNLMKIPKAKAISQRAFRTIKENIFFGVGVVHVVGIILVLMKIIGPIEAAVIHLVPDVLVFLNSVKLLHVKI